MPEETYTVGNKKSFLEGNPGELDGKENFLVELHPTVENAVQLLTTPGSEIGTVFEVFQPGQPNKELTVRLIGGGGTMKFVQSAAVAKGARLMGVAGGKVATATAGARTLGVKLTAAGGGDLARCEAVALVEKA